MATNDPTAFEGAEFDIKVTRNEANGEIKVDVIAHWIGADEDEDDKMRVSFGSGIGIINNASLGHKEKSCQLLQKVIQSALKGLDLPDGNDEREDAQETLTEQGKK